MSASRPVSVNILHSNKSNFHRVEVIFHMACGPGGHNTQDVLSQQVFVESIWEVTQNHLQKLPSTLYITIVTVISVCIRVGRGDTQKLSLHLESTSNAKT